jgi:ferric-dicitrate binding protein FerR (iron transport regulator)
MSTDSTARFDAEREALAAERKQSQEEVAAFEEFRDRIRDLDATPATGASAAPADGPGGIRVGGSPGGSPMDEIKAAYRDTVAAVPHYDDEYVEDPDQHFATELGAEIAAALEGNDRLTPGIQQGLVAAARTARASRDELLEVLDEERTALDEAEEFLADIESELDARFDEPVEDWRTGRLFDVHDRLDDLEERLDEFARDRQEMLDARPQTAEHPAGRGATGSYFYRDCDSSFPILSAVADVIDRIESHRTDIEDEISNR